MIITAIAPIVYKHFTKGIPDNSQIEQMRQEFANYRYQPKLNTWLKDTTTKTEQNKSSSECLNKVGL
jgi:hypothetical protein